VITLKNVITRKNPSTYLFAKNNHPKSHLKTKYNATKNTNNIESEPNSLTFLFFQPSLLILQPERVMTPLSVKLK